MKILKLLLRMIDIINELIGQFISYTLLLLMLIVVYDVCMRYFFNAATGWCMDLSQIILLICCCLGGGYTFLHNAHVKVDILWSRFSNRVRAGINLITHIVIALICSALFWFGGKSTLLHFRLGDYESTSTTGYLVWPLWMMVALAGLLLGLQWFAKFVRDWVMVIKGVDLKSEILKGEGGLVE